MNISAKHESIKVHRSVTIELTEKYQCKNDSDKNIWLHQFEWKK